MIITYLRSSSYGSHDFCPMKYFLIYNLGYQETSGKKADKGTIFHKVLEILAFIKLNEQNNKNIFEDDIVGKIDINKYNLDKIIKIVYEHYTSSFKHHTWEQKDYKDCYSWVYKALQYNNGMFDPRNRNIVQPEQRFDIEIKRPWSNYRYVINNEEFSGNLAIKGTIDLVTSVDKKTLEVIDYKTGKRLDWATGEEKTQEKLQNDAQLRIYHYAIHSLYPEIEHVIVSINFINDGGVFSICFDKSDLYKTEKMLKDKFEVIKNTKIPKLNKSWKCNKLCHFGKTTFEDSNIPAIIEYRENQVTPLGKVMTKCEQVHHDIGVKGVNTVIDEYTRPGYTVGQYKAPGAVE